MSNLERMLTAFSGLMTLVTEHLNEAVALNESIDDNAHDGANARAPTGDDYNALLDLIGRLAKRIGELG